jgi:predicted TIM-barrel fold metal-dependent hydrolase
VTTDQLVALAGTLERLPGTIVIDHMGRMPQPEGLRHPAFALLRKWLSQGRTWVKLSGPYLDTREGPPRYGDIAQIARELIRVAPERMVWGSDWPHPTEAEVKPDDAVLFDLLRGGAGSEDCARRILVDNPAALYGFR